MSDGFATEITPELHAELWNKHIGTDVPPVRLRVFTCTDHDGLYPVGTASVVVASDEGEARKLLGAELAARGLGGEPFTLTEVYVNEPKAIVLRDGDY